MVETGDNYNGECGVVMSQVGHWTVGVGFDPQLVTQQP